MSTLHKEYGKLDSGQEIKFTKPKLSKEQKINRQKLDALNHPGALMMLVDFVNALIGVDNKFILETQEQVVGRVISEIAARLKVQYMNEITPEAESKQMDIVDEINKQKK